MAVLAVKLPDLTLIKFDKLIFFLWLKQVAVLLVAVECQVLEDDVKLQLNYTTIS